MRLPRIAAMCTVAATLMAKVASAQNTVSVAGGATIPVGASADEVRTGYNASLALTAKPPLALIGIRLEGMFNSLGHKDNSTGTRTQRVVAAIANATASNPSTPFRSFYLIGGLGFYNTATVGGPSRKSNNDIGFNFGLGVNLTSTIGTFLEARYHHVPSELTTMKLIPITFGLRL